MKALIFSDTHGKISEAIRIIKAHKNIDLIIHLGDLVKDAEDIQAIFNDIKVEFIAGNNDWNSRTSYEKILNIENKNILITHGHLYNVKCDTNRIIKKAKDEKVDCVLFGHTHKSFEDIKEGICFLNPGSMAYSQEVPSYGLLEIKDNKINTMICKLKDF